MPFNPATGFTVGFGNQNPRQRTIADESTKFPGITKSDEAKIMNIAKSQAHSSYEESLIANDLYKEALKNQNSKNYVNNRQEAKQELYKQSINTKDTKQSNKLRTTGRTAEVADMIRNYAKSNGYGNTLEGWGDVDVINGFTNDNKQARQEIEDYINGDESSFNFSKRMGFGAGKNRSRFDMITEDKGEWNDDILGHFETESYEEAKGNKVGTWFKNLGKSAYNLASDLTNMVMNPLDTVNNLSKAAVGGVMNLTGLDDYVGNDGWFAEANQVADGMGDFLKDRYGGVDQIANSLYQDPVGVISDIASIATGGAGIVKGTAKATAKTAAKVGAKSIAKNASKVADIAGDVMKAGIKYDPATQILNAEGKALKGAYKGAKATVNTVAHPIESIKGAYRSVAEGLNNISDRGAEKITRTATAQDKLYKAQEPRMNILTKNKDLQKRRMNSDRANQLIVENGYKPTDTNSRLLAHEATMRKIWGEVERRINGGEAVQIDQSRLAKVLHDYISEQKSLGSSFNKADLTALQKELKTLEGKNIDLPTLEKKKQLYNSIINNRGEQKVSDVFANGIKKLTHEIGVIEDSILAEIPGDFQKLKNDFGALKDTYEDVFKADMKNQRKKGMGLTETYSRIEGAGDMLNGALSIFNGGAKDIIKGAGKVLIGKSLAKAKDVDFLVKQGFDELVNGYKKSGNDKIPEYIYQNNLNPNNTNNDLYGGNRMSLGDSRTSNGGLQEGGAEMSSRSLEMNGNGGGAEMSASGKSNGGASTSGKPIKAEPQEMESITNNLKAKNPKGAFVDTHTPEEYASYKNFTNSDKSATISVKPDGDIVNFVTDGTPGKGKELMFSAIENGGNKMDNYGAGLVKYYEKFGFEPVAKVKFNREYAPSNWNYARDGEPYIYVMKHNGDDIATVRNNYGKYPHKTSEELNALKELEYDEALKYRDDLMTQGLNQNQASSKTAKYQVADQTNTPEFKKWFDGSKIVDKNGEPLVAYHGTHGDFNIFDKEKIGSNTNNEGLFGRGFYFTTDAKYGDYYKGKGWSKDRLEGKTMQVYLDIKNPFMWNDYKGPQAIEKLRKELGLPKSVLEWNNHGDNGIRVLTTPEQSRRFTEALEKAGYDGVWFKYDNGVQDEIVAFNPNQIKSATDNIGTFDKTNPDIRYQKYGTAGANEKSISAAEGLNIRNFKNGKTVQELANQYGIDTKIVDSISTPEGQRAYGMYGDRLITLSKDLKESTVPHELLHGVFDMVDSKRRTSILEGIQKKLKVDNVQAEERLADSFSEYYRTGKFGTQGLAKGLVEKVKQFFYEVKSLIDGTYKNQKQIKQLFNDIIEGKDVLKQSDLNTSEDVYKYAQNNKESIFKQYGEKHGGYVNPDDFRDYINDGKRLEAAITHEGASSLADQYFEKLVAEHPNGKGIVVAGGPGGGKGTSIKALGIDKQGADILVDKTKGNKELKKMLDAGMEVDYYVVVPDADKIVSNIIGRAARGGAGGRTLPINSMGIPTHKKVVEIVKDLYKEGKETGKFNVKFIDNAGKIEEINLKEGMDGYKLLEKFGSKLDDLTPDVVEKEAKKRLDEGKITSNQYKQLIASMGGILFIGSVLGGGEE